MADQTTFILKLRRNIALEGDLWLAQVEIGAFLSAIKTVEIFENVLTTYPVLCQIQGLGAVEAYVRASGKQFFIGSGPLAILPDLIRRLSFVQDIYCIVPNNDASEGIIRNIEAALGPVVATQVDAEQPDSLIVHAIPQYAVIELSEIIAKRSGSPQETKINLQLMLDTLLDRTYDTHARTLTTAAIQAKNTTSHLSHDIHYYKAKFFPRMSRAMLTYCSRRLSNSEQQHRVLDNFAGSGTTLLEAAILGMPSVGLDIDPLSCLIARTKLDVAGFDSKMIAAEAARVRNLLERRDSELRAEPVLLPEWLLKNRKMTAALSAQLSSEIRKVQAAIVGGDPALETCLRVLLSDAISRRLRMRFLGTGVGRFSLTFSKATLPQMFLKSLDKYAKVVAVYEWLRETLHLPFAQAEVVNADTRCIPSEIGQFDILLTSPPYLPASSGRESYAKARALSLIALDLADHEAVDALVNISIGSMDDSDVENAQTATDLSQLTAPELETVRWLQRDNLRAIKAIPTARYFLDMRAAFRQMFGALRSGGLAVVVSGSVSTFYQFSTRQVVHTVRSAELLAEEAQAAGFEVEGLHHLQLQKSNANARPRSLDDYYETLIMLRKPDK